MHVTDKRVFNFSDSVMVAIQSCDSFALEVHPDSVVYEMLKAFGQTDAAHDLHKLLGEKEYAELAKRFEEKNGYPMREDMNPIMAASLLKKDSSKPGDKDSFIDAYLYGIARTMNKKIFGLENTSRQFDAYFGAPDKIKERLEELLDNNGYEEDHPEDMIKLYAGGNLDSVQAYMDKYNMSDSVLVERNKVMMSSIIKYMKNGTIFSAVGVAHLPTNTGLIALLRQAGYTLTPVKASFTGVAAKYSIDYNKIQWVTHTDTLQGYSLQFPAEPIKTNLYVGLSTLIYADISNESFYGIYAIQKGSKSNPASREQVVGNLLSTLTKNKVDHIISKKNITINGLLCTDITMKTGSGYQRFAMFFDNNILYYLYVGNRLSTINSTWAERFIHSFKTFAVADKKEKNWILFKNDTGAFAVRMPVEPYLLTKEVPTHIGDGSPIILKVYLSTDTVNLMNYIVRYNDYPVGTYLAHKDALFNAINKEFGTAGKIIGKPHTIWLDGYEGREVKFILKDHYNCLARMYARGNRIYFLVQQNLHEDQLVDTTNTFFGSFSFKPYIPANLSYYQPDGAHYKILFPSKPKILSDTVINYNNYLQHSVNYYTTSPTTGGVYVLEHDLVSKYYRTDNTDSLYTYLIRASVTYTDSLIKVDTVTLNGKKEREFIVQNKDTKDLSRKRIWIDGDEVFILSGRLNKEELYSETSNNFYSSLIDTNYNTGFHLAASKAALITGDLQSADSTDRKAALGALSYYKFTKSELPFIYRALQNTYADDTLKYGARYKMIETLETENDSSTVNHLLDIYPTVKNSDALKSAIISAIPKINKQKGYDIYFNLLVNEKPLKLENSYLLFRPLYDSLSYAARHFQQILTLISVPSYTSDLLSLCNTMLDEKKPEFDKLLKDNFNLITKNCFKELDDYLASKDSTKSEWSTNIYKYFELMEGIKGEPVTAKFTSYYISKNPKGYNITDAVVAPINNGLPVDPLLSARLMDSIDNRYELMEAFYKQHLLSRIPEKYREQEEFAKLCLYKFISSDDDEDGSPEKMTLLGTIQNQGLSYYTYKFMLPQREEGTYYIGIAGPYKLGATTLDFERYNAYTEYGEKTANWRTDAAKLIKSLKKQYQPVKVGIVVK